MRIFIYILVTKIKKMINRFFKIIHNKYSTLFGFIYFLRYLIIIFSISTVIFLFIPNFFNYENKMRVINSHLSKNYNFKIDKYSQIRFKAFPRPSLEFNNSEVDLNNSLNKLNVKKLVIYPKLFSIYNFENYQSNKIILKNSSLFLEASDLQLFIQNLFNIQKNLLIDKLDLKINNNKKEIIELKNIKLSNFGYNKNFITGEVFEKKFKVKTNNNFDNITLRILKSGIEAGINLDNTSKESSINGVFKSKILNSNLKFNFDYNNSKLNIYNSSFRSKSLSFKNNIQISLYPFVDFNSKFIIEDINLKILENFDITKFLDFKDTLKKVNSKSEINFRKKKFSRNLIDELSLKVDLAYGRANYIKKFSFSNNSILCRGNVNLLEEYPSLFFNCNLISENKQNFLKEFSIKSNSNEEAINLKFMGNLNILNKKIFFKNISLNDNYDASKEDLKYFKRIFEDILFDKSFIEIFNLKKIKEFILEIN